MIDKITSWTDQQLLNCLMHKEHTRQTHECRPLHCPSLADISVPTCDIATILREATRAARPKPVSTAVLRFWRTEETFHRTVYVWSFRSPRHPLFSKMNYPEDVKFSCCRTGDNSQLLISHRVFKNPKCIFVLKTC